MTCLKLVKKEKKLKNNKDKKRKIKLLREERVLFFIVFFLLILVLVNFLEINRDATQAAPFISKTLVADYSGNGRGKELEQEELKENQVYLEEYVERSETLIIKNEKNTINQGDDQFSNQIPQNNQATNFNDDLNDLPRYTFKAEDNHWFSFGDTFSSSAYLDMKRTDMYLDENATALTFTPLYKFSLNSCQLTCLSNNDYKYIQEAEYRKNTGSEQIKILPKELLKKNVLFKAIFKLETKQIATFITQENGQENVYAYFYNSGKYEKLLSSDLGFKTKTKYARPGGLIDVSGDDNNFLIIYSGYEIMAFHYNQGEIIDISHLLGLRMASGGFVPGVVKQGEEGKSVWYIAGLGGGSARLIKLWQNNSNYISGSIDLSSALREQLRVNSLYIQAVSSGSNYGELEFLTSDGQKNMRLNFLDKGFDNSSSRQALSKNINSRGDLIEKAVLGELGLASREDGNDFSSNCKLYLGDSINDLQEAYVGKEVEFKGEHRSLYWLINCQPYADKYNSIWINYLNDIKYQASFG